MPNEFQFQYRFHPAGQGVFASGTLIEGQVDRDPFDWVVDCGSTNQDVLKLALEGYQSSEPGNRDLDLLCLTHFDKDHVSGLGDLIASRHVETVVMPYYTPLERLIIGSRHRFAPEDYYSFLGNPVAYLLEHATSIRTIILVGPPPPESDLGNALVERNPLPPPGSGDRKMPPKSEWLFEAKELQDLPSGSPIVDGPTRALAERLETDLKTAPGSFPAQVSRTSAAGWEFLFFHWPLPSANVSGIRAAVSRILCPRRRPGSSNQPPNITRALRQKTTREKIRKAYYATIPRPEDVNSTSLCVYSGPLPGGKTSEIALNPPIRLQRPRFAISPLSISSEAPHCSILYTGDAKLNTAGRRKLLHKFLTMPRRKQVSVLQVPHHGSRYNWSPGAEQHFYQIWSVFCANDRLKRPGHPHNEVFADLLYRGPVLVNVRDGWNWHGTVHFP